MSSDKRKQDLQSLAPPKKQNIIQNISNYMWQINLERSYTHFDQKSKIK